MGSCTRPPRPSPSAPTATATATAWCRSLRARAAPQRPRARGCQALRRDARPGASRSSRRWRSAPRASRTSSSTATRSTPSTPRPIEVPEVRTEALSREEIEHRIKTRLGRRSSSSGACTGSDAHTVGIDAILNYKGYAGDKGLESYKGFEVVQPRRAGRERPARRARARAPRRRHPRQPGHHAAQLPQGERRALVELAQARGVAREVILLFGGPRVDHKLALELGFDAGFGPGTKPSDVGRGRQPA
jgi:hypothetical protein